MYVEDKTSHQGPIPLRIKPSMTVMELKEKLSKEFEIPVGFQRWILGKRLASNEQASLQELGVSAPGTPVFLYLVAPGKLFE
jgi:RanBP-type and C3HC4-type zinc finger-containing protein 1